MKAERNKACEHTSRHTSPEDGELADSRKAPSSSSVEGSLPSSRKKYFDCQKTEGAGFKLPREAARSFNSLDLCFEMWEREAAPAVLMPDIAAIYGRLLSEFAAKNIGR
jgi:hypothetical protein